MILFVLTLIVISLSVISIRIQKSNAIQKKTFEQSQVRTTKEYSSIGVYLQGGRTLVKCPRCAELISIEAKICKECGSTVEDHILTINKNLIEFEKKQKEIRIAEKIEIQRQINAVKSQTKIVGLILLIAFPIIAGVLVITPIIKDNFFPTKIQKLASQWEIAFSQCGFSDVDVILNNKSDEVYEGGVIEAQGKFAPTLEKRKCLTDKLDRVYENFNQQGNRFASEWYIYDDYRKTWQSENIEPSKTYTLMHGWIGASNYVPDN